MRQVRVVGKLLGVAVLLWCGAPAGAATVAQVLAFTPRQPGVDYSTPKAEEQAACKVESFKGPKGAPPGASGWLLRDPQGLPLRRFYDSNGDNKVDVWSYYKDGVEVYREIDSKFTGKADQYRWLNGAGSRWGIDADGDGHIDSWKAITPEEISQEILQAVITHDFNRLQAVMVSDAELQDLPSAVASTIRELRKGAAAKFQATCTKLSGLGDKTRWLHLETLTPQCQPAEQTGARADYVKYPNATILCETAGKNEWLQTGEIVQVAPGAWRVTDAPSPGLAETVEDSGAVAGTKIVDKELQGLLEQLKALDDKAPTKGGDGSGPNQALASYHLQRADLLERVVAKAKPEEREPWIRQVADALSTAASSSPATDHAALTRLASLEKQVVPAMPGTNLAAYVAYRNLSAEYALKLAQKDAPFAKIQEDWLAQLAKFVQSYPRAPDTADALLQLGMVSEFVGKEIEAKKWYQQLAANFGDTPLAAKGRGAIERLDLEGKQLKLSGPVLGSNQTFDLQQKRGKVVVVYYWASWNGQCVGDFAKLKLLLDSYGDKGLDLVTVNLDSTPEEAQAYLSKAPAPGTHLYQAGGLDSPLAVQYGVMGLPNLFLVNGEGKVLSRTVQIANLEDVVKTHLKK
jgi:thiol-disulfide isomerase/thioredoxin